MTSRTLAKRLIALAKRPKTLANVTLAKSLVGEITRWRNHQIPSVVMTFFSVALHSPTQKFMVFLRVSAPLRYIFYVKKLFISHILRFILSSVNVRVFDWTNDIISQSFPSNL